MYIVRALWWPVAIWFFVAPARSKGGTYPPRRWALIAPLCPLRSIWVMMTLLAENVFRGSVLGMVVQYQSIAELLIIVVNVFSAIGLLTCARWLAKRQSQDRLAWWASVVFWPMVVLPAIETVYQFTFSRRVHSLATSVKGGSFLKLMAADPLVRGLRLFSMNFLMPFRASRCTGANRLDDLLAARHSRAWADWPGETGTFCFLTTSRVRSHRFTIRVAMIAALGQ